MQARIRISVLASIPRSVWVLGCVSLCMDISSEIVHSLLPMFLTVSLGASAATIGLIEGIAEATAPIVKVFSGALSDYLGNRKWLAVAGYALGALSKPLFAIAPTVGVVVSARVIDRVGKGIRGAPPRRARCRRHACPPSRCRIRLASVARYHWRGAGPVVRGSHHVGVGR